MRVLKRSITLYLLLGVVSLALFVRCSAPPANSDQPSPAAVAQEKGVQEEWGPYELVENWPHV
jgi:hypothetical protein